MASQGPSSLPQSLARRPRRPRMGQRRLTSSPQPTSAPVARGGHGGRA